MSKYEPTEALKGLIEELREIFFGGDPRRPGENPACRPIEDKIYTELDKLTDDELKEYTDSLDEVTAELLFTVIIDLYDSGRTFLAKWDETGSAN